MPDPCVERHLAAPTGDKGHSDLNAHRRFARQVRAILVIEAKCQIDSEIDVHRDDVKQLDTATQQDKSAECDISVLQRKTDAAKCMNLGNDDTEIDGGETAEVKRGFERSDLIAMQTDFNVSTAAQQGNCNSEGAVAAAKSQQECKIT